MNTGHWIAVGDSFTAGTGDDRGGWIRRTADELIEEGLLATFDNHARPGLVIDEVIEQQVPHLVPTTVVSAIAGANDIIRPKTDLAELTGSVDRLFRAALDHAEHVVTSTCPDFNVTRTRRSSVVDERVGFLNDIVAAVHQAEGDRLIVIDANDVLRDPNRWADDT